MTLLMALCLSLGAQEDVVRLFAENPDPSGRHPNLMMCVIASFVQARFSST